MYLQTLHLQRFRNYREQTVRFTAPKTVFVGENGQGKSNLLEAVELLALLKPTAAGAIASWYKRASVPRGSTLLCNGMRAKSS